MKSGDDEVDDLYADEGNDDAAEPVDQQVAPQQRPGADRPIGDPFSASGMSAMMISALKTTEANIGDSGECELHDVERAALDSARRTGPG